MRTNDCQSTRRKAQRSHEKSDVLQTLSSHQEAIQVCLEAPQIYPESSEPFCHQMWSYTQLGDFDSRVRKWKVST
jgi:hypothetical protein